MEELTARQVVAINDINVPIRKMLLGAKIQEIIREVNNINAIKVGTGTPVNAVNAAIVLTLTGVVVDGETVTIDNPAKAGTDVYEFLADAAQSKTNPGNIAVDITASTTKSSGTLVLNAQPTSGDTMTIGTKVYTFVPNGTANADGEISIGTDLATAQANIVAAINGTDGFNEPHPLVSAANFVAINNCTITALIGGVAGDIIATTETFTDETNAFGAATLGTGADCSAANAITALVTAITASDTQGIGAADGAGDTVDLTADVAGAAGNLISIAETLVNGAFAGGATKLAGGVNGTVGGAGQSMYDADYFYQCIAANTVADKNWRRISLGAVY